MFETATDLRESMLDAAEAQLVSSTDGDIATRAVCEAVGVSQPVLYRLFGDKRGLLDALADRGLDRYAAQKDALEKTDDPLADMRAGWDQHVAFAEAYPAIYRLMFEPRPWSASSARARIFELMVGTLRRVAAAGHLATSPGEAAQLLLSAHIGMALNRIADPATFDGAGLSHAMRDAMFARVLVTRTGDPEVPSEASGSAASHLRSSARQLDSLLELGADAPLEPAERALLRVWLGRLAD